RKRKTKVTEWSAQMYSAFVEHEAPGLAFIWSNGKLRNLGTLGGLWSQGYAINNQRQATGVGYLPNGAAHAFLWTAGKMTDLGTVDTTAFGTSWGFGVNNHGAVVGQSTFRTTYHAFMYSGGKIKDLNKPIPSSS